MEIYTQDILGDGLRATLRNSTDCSVLTHSHNSRRAVRLCLGQTILRVDSHVRETLSDILLDGKKEVMTRDELGF